MKTPEAKYHVFPTYFAVKEDLIKALKREQFAPFPFLWVKSQPDGFWVYAFESAYQGNKFLRAKYKH